MSDIKRFILIILVIFGVYAGYYFQGSISSVFDSNGDSQEVEGLDDKKDTSGQIKIIDEEDAVIKVVQESTPSVVSVIRKESYFDPFRGPIYANDSIGTGFVVDSKNGIVLTNRHVVDSSDAEYSVVFGEGEKSYDVKNIYKDPVNDFAILKLDVSENEISNQLVLGDSSNLKVGQTVIAIGNVLGQFGNSVTKGIVSGLGRAITTRSSFFDDGETIEDVIQTDAALNPGNSGGPLLDINGSVIGINVAISQGANNVGFTIPINSIKPVIEQFNRDGKIVRPFLGVGVYMITTEIAEAQSLPVGAYVQEVVKDSPAEKARIKAGDIILKVGDTRINDDNSLPKVVSTSPIDSPIDILIHRNGREFTVSVRLLDRED